MICPICKNEIKDNSKFCTKCGKQIPRCPTCNKVITKKMRFCMNDGTPLSDDVLSMFSEFKETMDFELDKTQKNVSEKTHVVEMDKRSFDDDSASNYTSTQDKENLHYCIRCGKPCSDTQVLCCECNNNSQQTSKKVKFKRKRRVFPLLCSLIFLIIAGIVGYSIYNDGIPLNVFLQNSSDKNKNETLNNEKDTEIDRSSTDDESEESSIVNDEDNIVDNTTESYVETTISEDEIKEVETENLDQEVIEKDPVEYFILNCDREYFTKEDLLGFDEEMCRISRNGIYARLGRKFQDEALVNYFIKFDWYNPTINPEDFSEELLNEYQIANRDLIIEYEEEQGYR